MMRYLGLTFCNLMGAKLNSVQDYLPLPWDDKLSGKELTEEEVDQLLELMRKENEELEKSKSDKAANESSNAQLFISKFTYISFFFCTFATFFLTIHLI